MNNTLLTQQRATLRLPPKCFDAISSVHASGNRESAVITEWCAGATIVTPVESQALVAMAVILMISWPSRGTRIPIKTKKVLHDSQTSLGQSRPWQKTTVNDFAVISVMPTGGGVTWTVRLNVFI